MAEISLEGARMVAADTPRRTNLSAADSVVLATFKTAHGAAFSVRSRSTVEVWAAFDTGGATATFEALFFARNADGEITTIDPIVSKTFTLTAKTSENIAGEFLSKYETVIVPGWPLCRLKLLSISAGTLDLYGGTL